MTVLVLVEHGPEGVDELSLQALALARQLGEPVEALLVGAGGADAAAGLGAHGVTSAHVAEDERLGGLRARRLGTLRNRPCGAARALGDPRARIEQRQRGHGPRRCPFPAAVRRELHPRRSRQPLSLTRVRWGGSLLEEARLHGSPALLSSAPHMVAAATVNGADAPAVESFSPALEDADLAVRVSEHVDAVTSGISLAEAKVVVSGGRGVGSAEGFGILEELAEQLDAAVGCSRVVTSAGWRPHTDQVGQTGTKVSPDLYIACGISGATQHIAGCKGAKKILAINSDAEAPILMSADYAVIGDLTEIVPAITAELRKARGS